MWIYELIVSFQNTPVRMSVEKMEESFISWVALLGNRRRSKEEANLEPQVARAKSLHCTLPRASHCHYVVFCLFEMLGNVKNILRSAYDRLKDFISAQECCPFLNLDSF